MTAASGLYQEWQSRIAYYHYKKQKALHPCSDLGGFTRLFNNRDAQPDRIMDEIPTLLVKQLAHGRCETCDNGFIVMNRPWGVTQLVESKHWRERITEEYVMLIETDHMMMKPPVNGATAEKPVGFGFYYMTANDPKLNPVVKKFLEPSIDTATVDAVGPSPVIMHKAMLEKVAWPWWKLSKKMQSDADALRIFGWVLEMWGYNLAARNMGIRHTVSKNLQVEPQGEGTDDMDSKYIYHYTFGLTPKPPHKGAVSWRLDKRMYYGDYPSAQLVMPPACTAKSGFVIASMWNEAGQNIAGWPRGRGLGVGGSAAASDDGGLRSQMLATQPLEAASAAGAEPTLGELLRGTGPWRWGKIAKLYLYARGVAYVPLGRSHEMGAVGQWTVTDATKVRLSLCGAKYELEFASAAEPWEFSATTFGLGQRVAGGSLVDRKQATRLVLPSEPDLRVSGLGVGDSRLASEIATSGPWLFAGNGPFSLNRGGVLITPWGEGKWGLRREGGETAAPANVFVDFSGGLHQLEMLNDKCLRMRSTRKSDGDKVGVDYMGMTEGRKCSDVVP